MIFNNIIDFIFPRRCPICHEIVKTKGKIICDDCKERLPYIKEPFCMKCGKPVLKDEEYCSQCMKTDYPFTEGRSVFVYDDVMRKSIYRFKYNGRSEYAEFFAQEIYRKYADKIKSYNADVIIPVPIHKSKLKSRGYNQAYLIAKELSKLTQIPVNNNYLIRVKKTKVQKNLGAKERSANLKNAFKIRANKVQYCSAILIDDIYTSGATLSACSRVLLGDGIIRVYCFCVCSGGVIIK